LSHGPDIPVPQPPQNLETPKNSASESEASDDDFQFDAASEGPQLFTQTELNDLVRDLCLPKESAELLGSRLKQKSPLAPVTTFSWYRRREKEFVPFFSQDGELLYCNDIPGLMTTFNIQHDASE
jgi:hypothetical protein